MTGPPRRHLPPWRRLVLEYAAMLLAYFAVFYITGNLIIAFVVMLVAMFALRATRPRGPI